MAFELKKRKVNSTPPSSELEKKEDFFFDLLLDEQWNATKWQLSNDNLADKEACFKVGFLSGFRYLQQVIEIQTNNIRESCGLSR